MKKEFVQKMTLANNLMNIILTMTEQGEDYSLVQRQYNTLVEDYQLPLQKIRWISPTEFEFVKTMEEKGV